MSMNQQSALEVVADHRGSRIVIPTMGAVGFWQKMSDTALDFTYMPSSMGQGPALGLGLALAQPQHGAIVLCGDGSLLMNLGCLVTIAQHRADLWLILLDNSQYEVTGGQPVAGAGRTDFTGLARSAGISRAFAFDDLEAWRAGAPEVFAGRGPVLVWLKLTPVAGQKTPTPAHSMPEQIARLQAALGLLN